MKEKYITTQDFDGRFEAGEDVTHYLDIDKAKRPGLEKKKINISFPLWMLKKIDSEAKDLSSFIQ